MADMKVTEGKYLEALHGWMSPVDKRINDDQ
jgi:hypothetical protein